VLGRRGAFPEAQRRPGGQEVPDLLRDRPDGDGLARAQLEVPLQVGLCAADRQRLRRVVPVEVVPALGPRREGRGFAGVREVADQPGDEAGRVVPGTVGGEEAEPDEPGAGPAGQPPEEEAGGPLLEPVGGPAGRILPPDDRVFRLGAAADPVAASRALQDAEEVQGAPEVLPQEVGPVPGGAVDPAPGQVEDRVGGEAADLLGAVLRAEAVSPEDPEGFREGREPFGLPPGAQESRRLHAPPEQEPDQGGPQEAPRPGDERPHRGLPRKKSCRLSRT